MLPLTPCTSWPSLKFCSRGRPDSAAAVLHSDFGRLGKGVVIVEKIDCTRTTPWHLYESWMRGMCFGWINVPPRNKCVTCFTHTDVGWEMLRPFAFPAGVVRAHRQLARNKRVPAILVVRQWRGWQQRQAGRTFSCLPTSDAPAITSIFRPPTCLARRETAHLWLCRVL